MGLKRVWHNLKYIASVDIDAKLLEMRKDLQVIRAHQEASFKDIASIQDLVYSGQEKQLNLQLNKANKKDIENIVKTLKEHNYKLDVMFGAVDDKVNDLAKRVLYKPKLTKKQLLTYKYR